MGSVAHYRYARTKLFKEVPYKNVEKKTINCTLKPKITRGIK